MPAGKPHILIVAGHRSVGDGGDDVERQLTDDLAVAYKAAFRADGYTADWYQEIDGDDLPTMTRGGLSAVALGCARTIAARPEPLVLMLDLHFNMRRSPVHAIVPHNRRQDGRDMLHSAFVQGRDPADIAANNPLDVRLAAAIAREIAGIPGMTLWRAGRSGVNGVMLENESGVGEGGSRLGMMAATAPHRMKAARLVIEHGGTDDDAKPDFFNRCALAALRAINTELANGSRDEPVVDRDPPEGDTGNPPLAAFLFGGAAGFAYNPAGPVSTLWRETGNRTGRFPRLVDVRIEGAAKWFVFSDGSVIVAGENQEVTHLDTVA